MKFNPKTHYLRDTPCRKCGSPYFYRKGLHCVRCALAYSKAYRMANRAYYRNAAMDRHHIKMGRCPITEKSP